MLTNGQALIIDMAVRALDHPLARRYREALVLGALREDSGFVPGTRVVYESLSLTHFYRPGMPGGLVPFVTPGPRRRADRFFARALAAYGRGRAAAAFVELGRALHLLADMACPVHAQRVVHFVADPYEWYVESHTPELRDLPVASVGDAERASTLVESLCRFTQSFPADRTHSPWGHLMWRLGRHRKTDGVTLAAQARALIPQAAGHAAALLRLFLREAATVEGLRACAA